MRSLVAITVLVWCCSWSTVDAYYCDHDFCHAEQVRHVVVVSIVETWFLFLVLLWRQSLLWLREQHHLVFRVFIHFCDCLWIRSLGHIPNMCGSFGNGVLLRKWLYWRLRRERHEQNSGFRFRRCRKAKPQLNVETKIFNQASSETICQICEATNQHQ